MFLENVEKSLQSGVLERGRSGYSKKLISFTW